MDVLALETAVPADAHGNTMCVRIADLSIALANGDGRLSLEASGASKRFLARTDAPDVRIRVLAKNLTDQTSGPLIFDSGSVWKLYREEGRHVFRFVSPVFGEIPYKTAVFRPDFSRGEVYLHRPYFSPGQPVDPLEYPLDELLMINLLAKGRGVEIHACGVVDAQGNGHLFAGQSGQGKSTMAKQWLGAGNAKILSDERIILRQEDGKIWMHGAPWQSDAQCACPDKAPLTQVFFLQHGKSNRLIPQSAIESAGRLFACSFPPFHDRAGLDFTLAFLDKVIKAVPCHELRFLPDRSVVSFIRGTAKV